MIKMYLGNICLEFDENNKSHEFNYSEKTIISNIEDGFLKSEKNINIASDNIKKESMNANIQKLRLILQELALLINYDQPYMLSSGVESPYIFNVKNICFNDGLIFLADALLDILKDEEFDYISGLEVGAIPIIEMVCCRSRSNLSKKPIDGFFVRKAPKKHGTKNKIDGICEIEKLSNATIIVLDDVTTTGKSVLNSIKELRSLNCKIDKVITVIDRKEGAKENLIKEGIKLIPLFTVDNFNIPTEEEWRNNYKIS